MKKLDAKKPSMKTAALLKGLTAQDLETTVGGITLSPCRTCGILQVLKHD